MVILFDWSVNSNGITIVNPQANFENIFKKNEMMPIKHHDLLK